jgi:formate C-acetyltransferase
MKQMIKRFIKLIPVVQVILMYRGAITRVYSKEHRNNNGSRLKKYGNYTHIFFTHSFIMPKKSKDQLRKIPLLLSNIKLNSDASSPFFYSIDTSTVLGAKKPVIGNLTPDYTVLLKNSVSSLLQKYDDSNKITKTWNEVALYCTRCVKYMEKTTSDFKEQKTLHLRRIITNSAETFYEALQRILFTNQLIWQEGHSLIGLGHLDKILYSFYSNDIQNGIITKEKALVLIKEFLKTLHDTYTYKSNVLLGDTGQIIILGGFDGEKYNCNDLTYMFIQALTELQIPDPKILLRVHRSMPMELLRVSVQCIQTGIGCPLFANDEVIIPALIQFGYEQADAFNYGVSACWEPFVIGKSSDANNIYSLNFLEPLQEVLFSEQTNYAAYDVILTAYKQQLQKHIQKGINYVYSLEWESAPLLSLFMYDCTEQGLDISEGGAKYNNYGITTVALANTINSLLNIKKYIYELHILTMQELKSVLLHDYEGKDDIQTLFKNETIRYGVDNDEVLTLTKDILVFTTRVFKEFAPVDTIRKIKFGLSSPSYISGVKNSPATPDGRNKNDPFAVHISNDKAVDFISLFSFASKIDYSENRFNGNVIDCIVSPHFIKNNFDQFVSMLYSSFISGIFEMQFNVITSDTLIKAKKSPEQFQSLIVRVWGFSAYFNDLPEAYKDVLIERTLEHEHAYS